MRPPRWVSFKSLQKKTTENQAGAAHANNCCKSYCNRHYMIILSSLWAACAGPANIHKQDKSTWIWQSTDCSTCRCAIQIWQAAGQQQETHLNESMVPHAVAVTNTDWAHHCPNQHLTARTAGWKQWRNARNTSCSESFPFTVMVFASSSVCLQPPWAKISFLYLFIIYSWCRLCFWYPGQKQARATGTWPPDRGPGSRRHSWLQFQGHLLWSMCPLWPSLTRFSNFCTFSYFCHDLSLYTFF